MLSYRFYLIALVFYFFIFIIHILSDKQLGVFFVYYFCLILVERGTLFKLTNPDFSKYV